MAGRRSAKARADVFGSIEDWMAQRNEDVQNHLQNAEAGRTLWAKSSKDGGNLKGERPSDLTALGAGHARATDSVRMPSSNWLDDSEKKLGGNLAEKAGQVVGAVRGARNTMHDAVDGALFVARLADPIDPFISPDGEAAWNKVAGAAGHAFKATRQAVSDPRSAVQGAAQKFHEFRVGVDPSATPVAGRLGDELRRRFEIGKNQGEDVFDVGSTLYGGEVVKGLGVVGVPTRASRVAKYLRQGASQAAAEHLAEPYEGMGHHNVPRRFRFRESLGPLPVPKELVGRPLPGAFMESPLNVLSPGGISTGDFYELHYGVDPKFYGAPMPASAGGGGWSGKRLGLKKYGPLGRAWHGSPAPLKAAVGAGTVGALGLGYDYFGGEDSQ